MKKLVYFLAIIGFVMVSCKDSSKQPESSGGRIQNTESGNEIHVAPGTISPEQKALIDNNRSHAYALIETRSQSEEAYSILTAGWWIYEAIFAGGERPKPVEPGYYIKFEDDFSYYYGQYGEVHGGGRYHLTYNTDGDPKMIMVDDNPNKVPEEWSILSKEHIMILVGSNYFGNNPKQMKLNKDLQPPVKPS